MVTAALPPMPCVPEAAGRKALQEQRRRGAPQSLCSQDPGPRDEIIKQVCDRRDRVHITQARFFGGDGQIGVVLGGPGRRGPREPQEVPGQFTLGERDGTGQQMGAGDNQSECADTMQGPSPTEECAPQRAGAVRGGRGECPSLEVPRKRVDSHWRACPGEDWFPKNAWAEPCPPQGAREEGFQPSCPPRLQLPGPVHGSPWMVGLLLNSFPSPISSMAASSPLEGSASSFEGVLESGPVRVECPTTSSGPRFLHLNTK